jgi:hypothetical protein
MQPGHFFVDVTVHLEWEHLDREGISWELFQGRLLDPAHTRQQRSFESWQVFRMDGTRRAAQPLLSVKWDPPNGLVHVVRGLFCHVREGYHAGDNVYLSRDTRKWVRELVGTIQVARFREADDFEDELICRLFQAVVGTSRLPLTSVEAPLPEFSLGQLGYFHQAQLGSAHISDAPMTRPAELIEDALSGSLCWLERVKLLETLLRATPPHELGEAADRFAGRLRELGFERAEIPRLLRGLFQEVALSPYTEFVSNTLAFLELLVKAGGLSIEEQVDFLGWLLRQLGRHLTAYDLVTFHHCGANYPDILLLDAALKGYLGLIDRHPRLFLSGAAQLDVDAGRQRLRRRALRQAWLLRRRYEGHPVPDAPTSPGENVRILPPPHVRVPDEQILDPSTRTKRLFAEDPLTDHLRPAGPEVWVQSLKDLEEPAELRELGMAIFLDRPMSPVKAPGEPDQTLLMSYEAFSRSVARQRLRALAEEWPGMAGFCEKSCKEALRDLRVEGIAPCLPLGSARPGGVSLADALKVADDFLVLATTRRSLSDFLALFDFSEVARQISLAFLTESGRVLILRDDAARREDAVTLSIYDAQLRRRLQLEIDLAAGYESRGGVEYPTAAKVVRGWELGPGGEDLVEWHRDIRVGIGCRS